jgi:hypothetical protein
MTRKLTILFLFVLNVAIYGQHNLGLKLNVGLSRISDSFNPDNATLKVKCAPSGQVGLYYDFQLGDKLLLGTELLFIHIEGRQRIEMDLIDISGNLVGQSTTDVYDHISYLGLPIYCGIRFNNLKINVGFQVAYVLTSSGREKNKSVLNGNISNWDDKSDNLNIDNLDYGPRLGLIFNLCDRLAIEGVYYYGINNILTQDIDMYMSKKIQQVTIGLRYTLRKKNK